MPGWLSVDDLCDSLGPSPSGWEPARAAVSRRRQPRADVSTAGSDQSRAATGPAEFGIGLCLTRAAAQRKAAWSLSVGYGLPGHAAAQPCVLGCSRKIT